MNTLELLKNEAIVVNNLLTEYVELHNSYLKSSGTFMSLFRKVNFNLLAGNAYIVFGKLRDERNKIGKIKENITENKEREFVECLFLYSKALAETAYLLFILLHALKEKANGNELSFSEHMENNKKYKKSIDTYVVYGQELNKLYASL